MFFEWHIHEDISNDMVPRDRRWLNYYFILEVGVA